MCHELRGTGAVPRRAPRRWPWVLIAAQALCAVQAARAYAGLPSLPDAGRPRGGTLPPVSVIVPARDEAHNLPALLPSLRALDYPAFEVVVVDDGSTDGSGPLAARLGARVLPAGPLPPGWAGKPHACAVGAAAAVYDWLLFADADTVHEPGSLAAAMGYVRDDGLEALSVFCGQRCVSLWERLLLPYAYRHFFAGVSAGAVNDPRRRESLANGQYILIARAAYRRIGGHAAVRDSIVEDVDLARLLKQHVVGYRMVRAERLVRVRMYRGLAEIRRGFAKNSVRFLTADPRRGAAVILSTLLDGLPLTLGVAAIAQRDRRQAGAAAVSLGVAVAGLWPWMRWFGVRGRLAALHPLAALAFQGIAIAGVGALRPGRTEWKGRRYR